MHIERQRKWNIVTQFGFDSNPNHCVICSNTLEIYSYLWKKQFIYQTFMCSKKSRKLNHLNHVMIEALSTVLTDNETTRTWWNSFIYLLKLVWLESRLKITLHWNDLYLASLEFAFATVGILRSHFWFFMQFLIISLNWFFYWYFYFLSVCFFLSLRFLCTVKSIEKLVFFSII